MAGSSTDVCLEYVKKGKATILLRAGHQYSKKCKYKNGGVLWECTTRKQSKCAGSITVMDNQVVAEKRHNVCEPDFARNEVTLRLFKLKTTLADPEAPAIPTAYNAAVSSLKDTGIDKIKEFPALKSIKTTLYKHRNAAFEVSKIEFKNVEEVKVPPAHQEFILADYNDSGIRVIAFCSEFARHQMKNLKMFLGDGTFWICPSPFYQLYTIHGDLGSTEKHINIVPLVYALMSHKNQQTYEILFSMLKSALPDWNPEIFKCDYEVAPMNAMRNVFVNISISGCYFHFTQAIWKKGKQLKLTKDKLTRRQVALSTALALLPSDKIIAGWFYVASQSPDDDNSKEFRNYMLRQWLQDDFIKTWCVFGQTHRTTNLVEAWNNKIKKRVKIKKPNIMKLLTALAEDASYYEVLALGVSENKGIAEKTKKSINRDNYIQEVQMELINNEITIGHCLEKLK
ncbi:uncharacterized protein [Epargyreus clarus]|uniref:uncharacterized protein n=1 Tax=Epargyreus clarus TaxID=520877 RepID=UPI003C2FD699